MVKAEKKPDISVSDSIRKSKEVVRAEYNTMEIKSQLAVTRTSLTPSFCKLKEMVRTEYDTKEIKSHKSLNLKFSPTIKQYSNMSPMPKMQNCSKKKTRILQLQPQELLSSLRLFAVAHALLWVPKVIPTLPSLLHLYI
ncbi:hypothetical protein V6N11_024916 [Hibiscus sabdariffa]|uniref:Uncharacterized protein n=1 Tax=Hibiscus sabdariffa TaxID=183260 RepID=A0ABR2QNJ2_9ROSI